MDYPFDELYSSYNTFIRKFYKDTDEDELVWHRDKEDRFIMLLDGGKDWLIQLEDELPKPIDEIFIRKDTYHRVIKGTEDMVVAIRKYVEISE